MLIQTSQDIFYIVLAICVAFITAALVVFLMEWIKTMKRVNRISGSVEEITENVNSYVRLPSIFLLQFVDWLREQRKK